MKVFVSWSGELAKGLAESLHSWLPRVIQAARPYFSAEDVAKGARWSPEIARELEESRLGILVVTKESVEAPWLVFEAGALSKSLSRAKVVPVLFGLEPTELRGPLVQFQAARFEKSEMKRVIRIINAELEISRFRATLSTPSFDVWWPHLSSEVTAKLQRLQEDAPSARRSNRDLLEEVLSLTRMTAKLSQERVRRPKRDAGPRAGLAGRSMSSPEVLSRLARGEKLSGANLKVGSLSKADLTGADLRGANLVRANLADANLTNANLSAANLEGATLAGSNLRGVDISRTNLWRAKMDGVRNLSLAADVTEANFFEVSGLSQENREFLARQRVVSLGDYPTFFDYYRKQGFTRDQMADLFLWDFDLGLPRCRIVAFRGSSFQLRRPLTRHAADGASHATRRC